MKIEKGEISNKCTKEFIFAAPATVKKTYESNAIISSKKHLSCKKRMYE